MAAAFGECFLSYLITAAAHKQKSIYLFSFLLQSAEVNVLIFSGCLWVFLGGTLVLGITAWNWFLKNEVSGQKTQELVRRLLWALTSVLLLKTLIRPLVLHLAWGSPAWWAISAPCLLAGFLLGYVLDGFIEKTWRIPRFFIRLCLFGIFLAGLFPLLQKKIWALTPTNPQIQSSPNVLFLVIDALRADHVSLYGYPKDTTPVIDTLAKEGAFAFRDCQANATWTQPSVQRMMTGKISPGIFDPQQKILAFEEKTLFERFHEAGYRTGWFVANPYAGPRSGLPQYSDGLLFPRRRDEFFSDRLIFGRLLRKLWDQEKLQIFKRLFHPLIVPVNTLWDASGGYWIKDDQLRDTFLKWLGPEIGRRPWVAYLHLMSVHAPYGDSRGQQLFPFGNKTYARTAIEPPPRNASEVAAYLDAYESDIPYADARIGEILSALKKRGDWKKTVVIVTADHGEEFGEHGIIGHEVSFHRGVTHIPLILRLPSQEKLQWVDTPVQLLDLMPTLISLCKLPHEGSAEGQSLLDTIQNPPSTARSLYHSSPYGVRGLRQGKWQLYFNLEGQVALYDLQADPLEKTNVADQNPQVVERLRSHFNETRGGKGRTTNK